MHSLHEFNINLCIAAATNLSTGEFDSHFWGIKLQKCSIRSNLLSKTFFKLLLHSWPERENWLFNANALLPTVMLRMQHALALRYELMNEINLNVAVFMFIAEFMGFNNFLSNNSMNQSFKFNFVVRVTTVWWDYWSRNTFYCAKNQRIDFTEGWKMFWRKEVAFLNFVLQLGHHPHLTLCRLWTKEQVVTLF